MKEMPYGVWLAELKKLNVPAEGVTTAEIREHTGMSHDAANRWLHNAVKTGAWKYVGRKPAKTIDGRLANVQAYAPVKK